MFEDFRKELNQMENTSIEDNPPESPLEVRTPTSGRFLGMTPVQRFFIAVMLLMMVVVLGILFLLVTSKIVLPFMPQPTPMPPFGLT